MSIVCHLNLVKNLFKVTNSCEMKPGSKLITKQWDRYETPPSSVNSAYVGLSSDCESSRCDLTFCGCCLSVGANQTSSTWAYTEKGGGGLRKVRPFSTPTCPGTVHPIEWVGPLRREGGRV